MMVKNCFGKNDAVYLSRGELQRICGNSAQITADNYLLLLPVANSSVDWSFEAVAPPELYAIKPDCNITIDDILDKMLAGVNVYDYIEQIHRINCEDGYITVADISQATHNRHELIIPIRHAI